MWPKKSRDGDDELPFRLLCAESTNKVDLNGNRERTLSFFKILGASGGKQVMPEELFADSYSSTPQKTFLGKGPRNR